MLIRGETGTGKELVAQAIHQLSPRCKAPFVAVNMAAVSESTAVSSLFGHARGAFTGAQQRHEGVFERAAGGTLLLDEIGETPGNVQAMLLRAIETRRVLPLGDGAERDVDGVSPATEASSASRRTLFSQRGAPDRRLSYKSELRARREESRCEHFIDPSWHNNPAERASELPRAAVVAVLSRIRAPLYGQSAHAAQPARHW